MLLNNFLAIFSNHNQLYLFRLFTANILCSKRALQNYWAIVFNEMQIQINITRPTTNQTELTFVQAGLRYQLWRGITRTNVRRGLRALARWLNAISNAEQRTLFNTRRNPDSQTVLSRLTNSINAATRNARLRFHSDNPPPFPL